MRILEKVYTTKPLKYKVADIKQRLRRRVKMHGVWLIVVNATAAGTRVELFSSAQVIKKFFPTEGLLITGLAETKDAAKELLVLMINDAMECTGSADLATYLQTLPISETVL